MSDDVDIVDIDSVRDCHFCEGGRLLHVVESDVVRTALGDYRKHSRDLIPLACADCGKYVLCLRESPHTVMGVVWREGDVEFGLIADDNDSCLIVGHERPA